MRLVAGSGVLPAAAPALALPIREVDVAIVGGGAAGIAAGRILVRAGVTSLVVEALRRSGGRCVTDTATFGVPFDRGAHWMHAGDRNPLLKLGRDLGLELYPEPSPPRLANGGALLSVEDSEAYETTVQAASEAIVRFAEARAADDAPASQGLPRDLGEWRGPVRFRLGQYDCGKPLSEISVQDFARAPGGQDVFCKAGYGTLIATLGRGVPTSLVSAVSAVVVEDGAVRLETAQGSLRAKTAIITVSTAVLERGAIRFTPDLDDGRRAAIEGLRLGGYLRVAMELPGNPIGVEQDTPVFLKTQEERTFGALARTGNSEVWYLDSGGAHARDLEAAGADAAREAAVQWLVEAFGASIRAKVGRSAVTGWNREPAIGGAWSVASPGRAGARAVLRQPHAERVLFAGEACHDALWGTVAGAWETGEAAAREAIRLVRG